MKITEKKIEFDFDDSLWSNLLKYDEDADYLKIEKLNGTKAVDIIGILENNKLVFFEIKDFRGHRITNKTRLNTGELEQEVALKVRDTLAGIIGAARNSTNNSLAFQELLSYISNTKKQLVVILWMEEDRLSLRMSQKRIKSKQSTTLQVLKKQLQWLTTKVWVANHENNPFSHSLKITFLTS